MEKNKHLSVWLLITIDIFLLAISLMAFFLFDYVLPQRYPNAGEKFTALSDTNLPGRQYNTTNRATEKIKSDTVLLGKTTETVVRTVNDEDINAVIKKCETGNGKDKITYFVADIKLTDISFFRTALADNCYGKNVTEDIKSISKRAGALISINGDFYGNCEDGVVVRNGILYREKTNDADICSIYKDGTMKTYVPSKFDKNREKKAGALQILSFGPMLLDGNGNVTKYFNTTPYLDEFHPRTAIGYIEPNHFVFVVVDGRNEGYSKGANLSELAAIMKNCGCMSAYNLDGGKSSALTFNGELVNLPADGGRPVSDIIYIGEKQ